MCKTHVKVTFTLFWELNRINDTSWCVSFSAFANVQLDHLQFQQPIQHLVSTAKWHSIDKPSTTLFSLHFSYEDGRRLIEFTGVPVGTNPHADTHQFPHIHTHMYTLACTHWHEYTHMYTHMYTVTCTHWHEYTHMYTHMYTVTCTHLHVYTRMYTLACTHSHVCTHSPLFTHHTLIYLHVLRTFAHLVGTPQEQKEKQGSQQMCCVYSCANRHFRPFHSKWLHTYVRLMDPTIYVHT